ASDEANISIAIKEGKADAVALASILHYDFIQKNVAPHIGKDEGNTEFLQSGKTFSRITPTTIKDIKEYLNNNSISVRL
ncbi:MAG: hypothetical protein PHD05_06900, partial [Sphaerochaetaceae bacterium]|nr:hypothetical protein [Sphaerochaetaceae bacterium]